MKYLIVVLASLAAVSALPTNVEDRANFTRILNRQSGFSTFGGGTRGGQGGSTSTVWDAWALRDAINTNDARIVQVMGRIDLTPLFTRSPGVILTVGQWTSIIGGNSNAEITGGGLKLFSGQQVIVQNMKFSNALSYAPGEQPNGNGGIVSMVPGAWSQVDAIDIEDSNHVWVDHCEFSDDPWISSTIPENMRRHDGLIDIKRKSNYVTISNSIFGNHNLVGLVGHSDDNGWEDIGNLKITYYGNWFMGTTQRNPRVRFGEVHVYNNLYTDITDYGVGAKVYLEKNVFINVFRAWGLMNANQNPVGYLLNVDNWLLSGSTIDSNVPSGVGWNPASYYNYSPAPWNGASGTTLLLGGDTIDTH